MFFAQLVQNGKGEYDRGEIALIRGEGGKELGVDDDAVKNAVTENSCAKWGYTDLSAAN